MHSPYADALAEALSCVAMTLQFASTFSSGAQSALLELTVALKGSSPVACMVNAIIVLLPGLRRVSENASVCNLELTARGTSHASLRFEYSRPGSQRGLASRSNGTASVSPGHRTPKFATKAVTWWRRI